MLRATALLLLTLSACPNPPGQQDVVRLEPDGNAGDEVDTGEGPALGEVDEGDGVDGAGPDDSVEDPDTDVTGCAAGCDDGEPCTDDLCSGGVCQHVANLRPCNDDNTCTDEDRCNAGRCVGLPLDCDDDNPCTLDRCELGLCGHEPVAGACDDGDACTAADSCEAGLCTTRPRVCSAGPCEVATCDPRTGCGKSEREGACDDGNACTADDACHGGVCLGELGRCDDGNACTDDYCDPAVGCTARNNVAACDDGDACTGPDRCGGSTCQPGPASPCCSGDEGCTDGDACTDDRCVAGRCTHLARDCEDGDPCTLDRCTTGTCGHLAWGPWPASGILVDDFEAGLGDWTLASTNTLVRWQADTSWAASGGASLYCGDVATSSYDFGATFAAASRIVAIPPQADELRLTVKAGFEDDGSCLYDVLAVTLDDVELGRICSSGEATTVLDVSAWSGREARLSLIFDTRDELRNAGHGVWVDAVRVTGDAAPACP